MSNLDETTNWINVNCKDRYFRQIINGEHAIKGIGPRGIVTVLKEVLPAPPPKPEGLVPGPKLEQRTIREEPIEVACEFFGKGGKKVPVKVMVQWTHASRPWHPGAPNARGWWDVLGVSP
jgi:hypothetical protein